MPDTIVVLTEDALQPSDVDQIAALYAGQDVQFEVLVPADTQRNGVLDFVDAVIMGESPDEARPAPDEDPHQAAADDLAASTAALAGRGLEASGRVVADDPLPALVSLAAADSMRELVVVTRPHSLQDAFHQDWASKARKRLGVPVVHFYSGTDRIVD